MDGQAVQVWFRTVNALSVLHPNSPTCVSAFMHANPKLLNRKAWRKFTYMELNLHKLFNVIIKFRFTSHCPFIQVIQKTSQVCPFNLKYTLGVIYFCLV